MLLKITSLGRSIIHPVKKTIASSKKIPDSRCTEEPSTKPVRLTKGSLTGFVGAYLTGDFPQLFLKTLGLLGHNGFFGNGDEKVGGLLREHVRMMDKFYFFCAPL